MYAKPRRVKRMSVALLVVGIAATASIAPAMALGAPSTATGTAAATRTTLKSSRPQAHYGDAGQLTATVRSTAAAGTPTGIVEFLVDGSSVGSVALDTTGHASLPLSEIYPSLAPGAHSVVAAYQGEGVFEGSVSVPLQQI